ncbi:CAAX amino terminal protease family [Halovivax ruber XH-70]|uniref:CAAX amino terminal protease family n=1 Tax=Halovivax ruber (strain DSM 18193 / JCM 13892 / XH-70) TaxID=797302 RepID=L0IEH0_HALRX|nr:type II CAAX endopeptidase family protein [Halovivax ruber]AGB17233.1 CAAX amino terminal protease family [Halovivax ruber XH-70]
MVRDLSGIRSRIEHHRVRTFLLVVYGWSWGWDAVYLAFGWWETLPVYINTFPRQWGLPIGAVVIVWASDVPLRAWLGRVLQWRFHPGLYLGALVLPVFVTNVQPALAAFGGGTLRYSPPAPLSLLLGFFLLNVILFGGVEEFGWRGFLQRQFQGRLSVLSAGLAVGVLWWAWHLPLFLGHPNFTADPAVLLQYTTFVVGASTVLGALVNATDGGVLPAVGMHAAINVGAVLVGSGGVLEGVVPLAFLVGSGAWWLLATVLVARYGRSMIPGSTLEPLSEPSGRSGPSRPSPSRSVQNRR